MEWLLTAILGAFVVWAGIYLFDNYNERFTKRGFPGQRFSIIKTIFVIYDLLTLKTTFRQNSSNLYNKLEGVKYYGIYCIGQPMVFVRDVELVTQLLVKDFSYFTDRQFPLNEEKEPLSAHLVSVRGDRWRKLRYKLAPTFSTGKLMSMFTMIREVSDELVDFVKERNISVEARQLGIAYSLNVIGMVGYGLRANAQDVLENKSNKFYDISKQLLEPSSMQLIRTVIMSYYPKFGKFLGIRILNENTSKTLVDLVRDAVKLRADSGSKTKDFLQLMMAIREKEEAGKVNEEESDDDTSDDINERKNYEKMHNISPNDKNTALTTDIELVANSSVFISNGSHSVSKAVSYAIYHLSVNPEIQEKVRMEIETVLANQEYDYFAVDAMDYLEKFINEVFRLHPPIGTLSRVCVKDFYQIPGTKHRILRGEELCVPVAQIQRDPKYFPDPLTFNPDRYVDVKSISKQPLYAFGVGPRQCLAVRMVKIEMKVFIIDLLRAFTMKLNCKTKNPLQFESDSFNKVGFGGLWIDFVPRN